MKRGTTLLELLLVLSILGILGAVAIVDLRRGPTHRENALIHATHQLDSMRGITLRAGRGRTVIIEDSSGPHTVTLLPDGSIVADSVFARELGLDRLTARTRVPSSPRGVR